MLLYEHIVACKSQKPTDHDEYREDTLLGNASIEAIAYFHYLKFSHYTCD